MMRRASLDRAQAALRIAAVVIVLRVEAAVAASLGEG